MKKKKKLPKPKQKSLDQIHNPYSAIKVKLHKIIKSPAHLQVLEDVVVRVNKIVINTYQFIKLYLIYTIGNDDGVRFPYIDEKFIRRCMATVSTGSNRGRKPIDTKLEEDLKKFYEKYYRSLNSEKVDSTLLWDILAYEAADMSKNILNNIKAHYLNRVRQFINCQFGLKERIKEIEQSLLTSEEKREEIRLIRSEVRKLKDDVFNIEKCKRYSSSSEWHEWLDKYKPSLIPNKSKFDKDSVFYDIHSNTIDYLPHMMLLNHHFEKFGLKQFHSVPIRSSIKPSYITIDTTVLIVLFGPKGKKQAMKENVCGNKNFWNEIFDMKNKVFKRNNFVFNDMIKTDGLGTSLLFIRRDLYGKERVPQTIEVKEQYITEAPNKDELNQKKVVAIDPNKGDIIYCIDDERTTFRYTANQRRFETGTKRYNKDTIKMKETVLPRGYTVQACENILAKHNSKTCDMEKFAEYIRYKTEINERLFEHYQQEKFRRYKFNIYTNTQRSEAQMINNFRRKYGEPEDVVIAFGDHEQHKQMKYHEPTKDIGMRRLFRKNGFQVYLVDEYRTSKRCNNCGCDVENFLDRPSKRPWRKGEVVKVHGLVRCTNANCKIKWNRDYNAALNILDISNSAIVGQERPVALRRGNGLSKPSELLQDGSLAEISFGK